MRDSDLLDKAKQTGTREGEDHDDGSLLADGLSRFAAAFAPWVSYRKGKRTLVPRWIESFRSDGARARVAAAARLGRIGTLSPFVLPFYEEESAKRTAKSDLFSADWRSVMRADAFPTCYTVVFFFKLYLIERLNLFRICFLVSLHLVHSLRHDPREKAATSLRFATYVSYFFSSSSRSLITSKLY